MGRSAWLIWGILVLWGCSTSGGGGGNAATGPTLSPSAQFEILQFQYQIEPERNGGVSATGEFKNRGTFAAAPKLRMTARDAEGKVTGVSTWNAGSRNLEPGESAPFSFGFPTMMKDQVSASTTVTLEVVEVVDCKRNVC